MITGKPDNRKRIVVPQAKPGQVYAIDSDSNGIVTLTPMKPIELAPANYRFVKEKGFTVIETDRVVSEETIKEILSDIR